MTLRLPLALLVAGLSLTSKAQDVGRFFPHGVGDRWVYELEGVVPYSDGADTLDTMAEWRVVAVRPSADADTVVIDVTRLRTDGGSSDTSTCEFIRRDVSHPAPFLTTFGAAPPSGDYTLCRIGGGVPLSSNTYPFLYYQPDSVEVRTVEVGGREMTRETAIASFSYDYCGIRCEVYETARVRSLLVDGVGQVELEATYAKRDRTRGVDVRRDTLRARLVGAEVGGVVYGRIRPVSAGPAPPRPSVSFAAYPNPTAGGVTLSFSLAVPADVAVDVLDVTGRTVRAATLGRRAAGPGTSRLSLGGLPAGAYVVRLRVGGAVATVPVAVAR